MPSTKKILYKFLKILFIVLSSVVFLLIAVALLIQVPSIQNKIVSKATALISDKTQTKVSLGHLSLVFPGRLSLDNIYLEDKKKDTLLYAANISAGFNILRLIKKDLYIDHFSITGLQAAIYNTASDSVMNYQFLIDAFADSAKTTKAEADTTSQPFKITLEKLTLNDIYITYYDIYHHTTASLQLKELNLSMHEMDIKKQIFKIGKLNIEDLAAKLDIAPGNNEKENTESSLPLFSADDITLNNVSVEYSADGKKVLQSHIGFFRQKDASVDLNRQIVKLDEVTLDRSSAIYYVDSTSVKDTIREPSESPGWSIEAGSVKLNNNRFALITEGAARSSSFNPDYIEVNDLSLDADHVIYNTNISAANIHSLSVKSGNEFELKQLSVNFKMTPGSISAKAINMQTARSHLKADVQLQFNSLESLKDSIGNLGIAAFITKSHFSVPDILWIQPSLADKPFLNNRNNYAELSGNFHGKLNNIQGKKIMLRSGGETLLTSDFYIKGLPETSTAYFDLPDLKVKTSAKDLTGILGKNTFPSTISLPALISVSSNFKGTVKSFRTTTGISTSLGNAAVEMTMKPGYIYTGSAKIKDFDIGHLLKNKSLGEVTMQTTINGKGIDTNTIDAHVALSIEEIYFNEYNYKNIAVNGHILQKQFDGKIAVNDTNLALDFNGLVDMASGNEKYKFDLDLKGADLKNLHFSTDDLRIGLKAVADLKGNQLNTINGTAGITQIILAKDGNKYVLDSLMLASINEKGKSKLDVKSAIISVQYTGSMAVTDVVGEMKHHFNRYFPLFEDEKKEASPSSQDFSFVINIRNHPVLKEVFLPSLEQFDIDPITGSFSTENQKLDFNLHINSLQYDSISITDALFNINSDANNFKYQLTASDVSNADLRIINLAAGGNAADGRATMSIAATNENKVQLLVINSTTTYSDQMFRVGIDPGEFILAGKKWEVNPDNYIGINKEGFVIHNIELKNNSQSLAADSPNDKVHGDISISVKNLIIDELSDIIKKDKRLAGGIMNGNILLKKTATGYGFNADVKIDNLAVNEIPAGNLVATASSVENNKFRVDASLKGNENDLTVTGYFSPADSVSNLNLDLDINHFSMLTIQSLAPDNLAESSGSMQGKFKIKGNTSRPDVDGYLQFKEVRTIPVLSGSPIYLKEETIKFSGGKLTMNNFTVRDANNSKLEINGTVADVYDIPEFNLDISSVNYELMNSARGKDKEYYGKIIIDSRIKVRGDMNLPVVTSRVHLKDGSDFTFVIPEKKLSADRGETVVVFVDSLKFHPIIVRDEEVVVERGEVKGFDISSTIEVDKKATMRILIDPATNDSLVVRGEAALNFAIDPNGKTSLTGTYSLNDGSYVASLESLIRKKFLIRPGSTITWNGAPTDALLDITAVYTVRTSPIDLVSSQISGLSDLDKNNYRMRIPFEVLLKMNGELMRPDISFEIQLPPSDKGVLGGAVDAQLTILNEDESALNKQVFALLVLGRFVQENPLETENGGASTAARTSVSKFLTQQLNQLSSQVIHGVDLSFDVQSYEDFSSGNPEGRTEVGIGLQKQLFDERLSVQVGGTVDVEGERSNQNNASDITGDVTVEYKLTEDGRYRLKGFRHNQYEGALEGQLVETGAGVVYSRDFNRWKNFLRLTRREKAQQKNEAEIPDHN